MRDPRTPTGVMVTPLDLSGAAEDARQWLNRHREIDGKPPVLKMRADNWGIVDTPSGLYALCTEGVGPSHPITDEKPLAISFWVEKTEGDGEQRFIAMMPACESKVTPDTLREWAMGEPVNLADWVRAFGARLEANYEGWRRTLEAARGPGEPPVFDTDAEAV